MTITLAIKSQDTVWLGADSRAYYRVPQNNGNGTSAPHSDLEPLDRPVQKIHPIQEIDHTAPASKVDLACTVAGSFDRALLSAMHHIRAFDCPGPHLSYLMANCAAELEAKPVNRLSSTYLVAGFDLNGQSFASRTTWRTSQLVFSQGPDWCPSFSDSQFGLEINGIDEVIDWIFQASERELMKLYQALKILPFEEDESVFIEQFCSDIHAYKREKKNWNDLESSQVADLVRGFLRITSLLNTKIDLENILSVKAFKSADMYSGPPFTSGYIRKGEGFTWVDTPDLESLKYPGVSQST